METRRRRRMGSGKRMSMKRTITGRIERKRREKSKSGREQ